MIFGGEGEKGLLNDMYRYSISTNSWTLADVRDLIYPTARRGACMTLGVNHLFIFGGWSTEGYRNDLWLYDPTVKKYRLLNDGSDYKSPPPVANIGCSSESINGDIILYIFAGDSHGLNPFKDIYYYNMTALDWSYLGTSNLASSNGVTLKIDSRIISIGGIQWGIYPVNILSIYDLNTRISSDLQNVPIYLIGSSYVYFGDNLYVHGGGDQFDGYVTIRPNNRMYKISLNRSCQNQCNWSCSKGTYYDSGQCKPCDYGSYSSTYGATSCQLCSDGSFGPYLAASDEELCLRCPEGSFNSNIGQRHCLDCQAGAYCPIGSVSSTTFLPYKLYSSIQPTSFKSERRGVEDTTMSIQIGFASVALLIILIVLAFSYLRGKVAKLDVFSEAHYNEDDKPMIKRQTRLGGFFSLSFLFIALIYSCTTFLSYGYDNIQEIKTLVPIVTLADDAPHVRSI